MLVCEQIAIFVAVPIEAMVSNNISADACGSERARHNRPKQPLPPEQQTAAPTETATMLNKSHTQDEYFVKQKHRKITKHKPT
jgi:hypothetical protein